MFNLISRRRWLHLSTAQLLTAMVGRTALAVTPTEVNRANQAELEMVRGIGPQLSEQLLAERRETLFADWFDLIRRLRGVGPARAAKLSEAGLRVNGEAYRSSMEDGRLKPTPSK